MKFSRVDIFIFLAFVSTTHTHTKLGEKTMKKSTLIIFTKFAMCNFLSQFVCLFQHISDKNEKFYPVSSFSFQGKKKKIKRKENRENTTTTREQQL